MRLPLDTFPFLTELANNNNREWFNDHKSRFQLLQKELIDYVDELIGQMMPFEPLLAGVMAKDCLFRIHKDARFSKGQDPYKTHFGIHIVTSGRRSDFEKAGFYLHIAPGTCSMAGGAHAPSAVWLKRIRERIELYGAQLEAILAEPMFNKYFGGLKGAQLIRPPMGFAKDSEYLSLLKYKQLWVTHAVPDEVVLSKDFVAHYLDVFQVYQPFQAFLNKS